MLYILLIERTSEPLKFDTIKSWPDKVQSNRPGDNNRYIF